MAEPNILDQAREAVVVRPGDTLLVRVPPDTGPTAMGGMADAVKRLEAHLPEGITVLVVACEQIACVREE